MADAGAPQKRVRFAHVYVREYARDVGTGIPEGDASSWFLGLSDAVLVRDASGAIRNAVDCWSGTPLPVYFPEATAHAAAQDSAGDTHRSENLNNDQMTPLAAEAASLPAVVHLCDVRSVGDAVVGGGSSTAEQGTSSTTSAPTAAAQDMDASDSTTDALGGVGESVAAASSGVTAATTSSVVSSASAAPAHEAAQPSSAASTAATDAAPPHPALPKPLKLGEMWLGSVDQVEDGEDAGDGSSGGVAGAGAGAGGGARGGGKKGGKRQRAEHSVPFTHLPARQRHMKLFQQPCVRNAAELAALNEEVAAEMRQIAAARRESNTGCRCGALAAAELAPLLLRDLRAECELRGISSQGGKQKVIERLVEHSLAHRGCTRPGHSHGRRSPNGSTASSPTSATSSTSSTSSGGSGNSPTSQRERLEPGSWATANVSDAAWLRRVYQGAALLHKELQDAEVAAEEKEQQQTGGSSGGGGAPAGSKAPGLEAGDVCPCAAAGISCHFNTCSCDADVCSNRQLGDPTGAVFDTVAVASYRMAARMLMEQNQDLFFESSAIRSMQLYAKERLLLGSDEEEEDEDEEEARSADGSEDSAGLFVEAVDDDVLAMIAELDEERRAAGMPSSEESGSASGSEGGSEGDGDDSDASTTRIPPSDVTDSLPAAAPAVAPAAAPDSSVAAAAAATSQAAALVFHKEARKRVLAALQAQALAPATAAAAATSAAVPPAAPGTAASVSDGAVLNSAGDVTHATKRRRVSTAEVEDATAGTAATADGAESGSGTSSAASSVSAVTAVADGELAAPAAPATAAVPVSVATAATGHAATFTEPAAVVTAVLGHSHTHGAQPSPTALHVGEAVGHLPSGNAVYGENPFQHVHPGLGHGHGHGHKDQQAQQQQHEGAAMDADHV